MVLAIMKLGGTINLFIILTEFPSYLKYMFGIDTVTVSVPLSVHGKSTRFGVHELNRSLWMFRTAADKILARKVVSKNILRKFCVAVSEYEPKICVQRPHF